MKLVHLLAVAALSSMPLRAQACADLQDLGTLGGTSSYPWAVSADGRFVVGSSDLANGDHHAFRWTAAGGMQDLGTLGSTGSDARGVSGDGSVVVGWSVGRAFRWTAASGMQDIHAFPFGASGAQAVNADGSIVVGGFELGSGVTAFRWTAATGMQGLGFLGEAYGVSGDGSVVVGQWYNPNNQRHHAFRWSASTGLQDLGTLGGHESLATAVSADGRVVVGIAASANANVINRAFRWTAGSGMQDLGTLGGNWSGAEGVSADGSVVVGTAQNANGHGRPFRWTAGGGMQDLGTPGGGNSAATDVSADGSVVVLKVPNPRRAFRVQSSVMGTTYCRPTVQNSTGCGGIVLANGDPNLATGALDLTATLLPMNSFGFFLTSQMQGNVVNSGGSQGTLCLGGNIGRFVGPGQVMNSGTSGSFTLTVDLNAMPTPTGLVAAQPGETWNFQAWHRDANPTPTSNFTDAVSITFQ